MRRIKTKADLDCLNMSQDLKSADLRGTNLKRANLRGANLEGVNLRDTDLRDADLEEATLKGVNLRDTDLRDANLGYANLIRANLRYTTLRGADLKNCTGNGREIKSMQLGEYNVVFTKDILAIGCRQFSIERWKKFTNDEIEEIENDEGSLLWQKWKDFIFLAIERCNEKTD